MPTSEKVRTFNHLFTFDERLVRRLDDEIASRSGSTPHISLALSDGTELSELSAAQLISFPNLRSRRILEVTIATEYSSSPYARISFSTRNNFAIKYTIRGDDDIVLLLSKSIEDLINHGYPWYSYLRCMPFVHRFIAWFALVICAVIISVFASIFHNFLLLILSTLVFSITWLFGIIVKTIFPFDAFAIGDGVDRHKKSRQWTSRLGTFVLIVVVAGICVNLASSYIYSRVVTP